jgi:hypothetical protein
MSARVTPFLSRRFRIQHTLKKRQTAAKVKSSSSSRWKRIASQSSLGRFKVNAKQNVDVEPRDQQKNVGRNQHQNHLGGSAKCIMEGREVD